MIKMKVVLNSKILFRISKIFQILKLNHKNLQQIRNKKVNQYLKNQLNQYHICYHLRNQFYDRQITPQTLYKKTKKINRIYITQILTNQLQLSQMNKIFIKATSLIKFYKSSKQSKIKIFLQKLKNIFLVSDIKKQNKSQIILVQNNSKIFKPKLMNSLIFLEFTRIFYF
ncbi:hypothetical protein TTHERM_000437619 (macronuclear) [Tetrahymena thermophila SB210]|uniref:Uncharacterized protein n=1 Tax=Tetrahymena thermophila (strain SB210) TaxID=312017 RepID=W7X3S8_TETTS|nr:hypothetical protein TTHERM_000437619 [Tetrahymena thermophila SB210]EWS73970.1 hypothetical protein TTHERM_000437619 [Tetrahymena thermophila SB210]|eukprot:XP_012653511.1 hypothetical protein TTHERM_000437619 [Tetrahymena thermophila SB210]